MRLQRENMTFMFSNRDKQDSCSFHMELQDLASIDSSILDCDHHRYTAYLLLQTVLPLIKYFRILFFLETSGNSMFSARYITLSA